MEHLLFPTRRYPDIDEAEDAARARALLRRSSPSSPAALNGVGGFLQKGLDLVLGAGRYRVGVAARNTLLRDTNALLEGSLASDARDAATALSNTRRKLSAVLATVEEAAAAVQQEMDALALGEKDRGMVREVLCSTVLLCLEQDILLRNDPLLIYPATLLILSPACSSRPVLPSCTACGRSFRSGWATRRAGRLT